MAERLHHIERIRQFETHVSLLPLWESIRRKQESTWLPGFAFEYLILRAFELEGAEITWPFSVDLFGEKAVEQIDGMIYAQKHGVTCLVEAKDWNERVPIAPIAKMRGQLARRPGQLIGCVFTSTGYTEPAIVLSHFCAPQTILLWNAQDIDFCLKNQYFLQGLHEKYKHAMEEGKPDLYFGVK